MALDLRQSLKGVHHWLIKDFKHVDEMISTTMINSEFRKESTQAIFISGLFEVSKQILYNFHCVERVIGSEIYHSFIELNQFLSKQPLVIISMVQYGLQIERLNEN